MITVYETVLHRIIFSDNLPFLPLALTSLYCALGVTYCYLIYYYQYMFVDKFNVKELELKKNGKLSTDCE